MFGFLSQPDAGVFVGIITVLRLHLILGAEHEVVKRPFCGDSRIAGVVGVILFLNFDFACRHDCILSGLELIGVKFCVGRFIHGIFEALDCGERVPVFLEDERADALGFVFSHDILGLMWFKLRHGYSAIRSSARTIISGADSAHP